MMLPILLSIAVIGQPPVYGTTPGKIVPAQRRDDSVTSGGSRYLPLPHELVQAACADMRTLPLEDQPHQQYFAFRDSTADLRTAFDVVLSLGVNRGSLQMRSARVGKYLLRIDKRDYLPVQNQVEKSLNLIPPRENFDRLLNKYVDPYYTINANDDNIDVVVTVGPTSLQSGKSSLLSIPEGTRINVLSEVQHNGLTWVKTMHAGKIGFIRKSVLKTQPIDRSGPVPVPALHVTFDEAARQCIEYMIQVTGVLNPIVDAERWNVFSLRQTAGGFYYELRGVVNGDRRLNQAEILKMRGASESASLAFRSTNTIGMWRSFVTGAGRRIYIFFGVAARPSDAFPIMSITEDRFKDGEQVGQHPIFNLLPKGGFVAQGKEALFTLPTGLWEGYLFDGDGDLVNAAPGNLVSDRTVPTPHSTELEPVISCIRCHAKEDGWRSAPNSVQQLLGQNRDRERRTLVVGDLTQLRDGRSAADVLNEIASLYQGDATAALSSARDSFNRACENLTRFDASGFPGDGPSVYGGEEALGVIGQAFNDYWYQPVSPSMACRDLGIYAPDNEIAKQYLTQLIPPLPSGREDPALLTIRAWNESDPTFVISRQVWEQILPATLHRALTDPNANWGLIDGVHATP